MAKSVGQKNSTHNMINVSIVSGENYGQAVQLPCIANISEFNKTF
jgi:hypothetical protein